MAANDINVPVLPSDLPIASFSCCVCSPLNKRTSGFSPLRSFFSDLTSDLDLNTLNHQWDCCAATNTVSGWELTGGTEGGGVGSKDRTLSVYHLTPIIVTSDHTPISMNCLNLNVKLMVKSHIWLLEYFWLTNIRNKDYKNWWKWLKAKSKTTPSSFSHYLQPLLCDQNIIFSTAACSSWSFGILYQPQLGALSAWAKQL